MPYYRTPLTFISCLPLWLLACSNCSEQPKKQDMAEKEQAARSTRKANPADIDSAQEAATNTHALPSGQGPEPFGVLEPYKTRLLPLDGEVDIENRYAFTVMITSPHATTPGAEELKCSGTLIDPRLVLTAGHCVCMRQEAPGSGSPQATLIDHIECAKTATLKVVTYLSPTGGTAERSVHGLHKAEVRPHPALKILLDAQGDIVSSHADLAVLILGEPLSDAFVPVKLAETGVALSEPITLVGFGDDGSSIELYEKRRFSTNRAARLLAGGEKILLNQPKRPAYQHDSGGSCLRETTRGPELVGISNRGFSQEPTCTSTHYHGKWLHEEVLRAATAGSATPSPERSP